MGMFNIVRDSFEGEIYDFKVKWQGLIAGTIGLLSLSMCVGLNNPLILTQYEVRWEGLVLRFLTMNDTCMLVLYS